MFRDVKNLFKLKKKKNDNAIQSIINLFRLRNENEATKDRIIRAAKRRLLQTSKNGSFLEQKLFWIWKQCR